MDIPLVLMGYLNPIMQYGAENFCRSCHKIGIDGVIVPDLPFREYMTDYKPMADRYGLTFIMLITPETSEERIRLIDENTEGFVYMVSTVATTGSQESYSNKTLAYFSRINAMGLRNPRLIGFGVSNKNTWEAARSHAAGAIVGSAFVSLLGNKPSVREAVSSLRARLE